MVAPKYFLSARFLPIYPSDGFHYDLFIYADLIAKEEVKRIIKRETFKG